MRTVLQFLARFTKKDDGPTAVEYAVLLGLIACVCMAAIAALGQNSNSTYNKVGGTIKSAISSGGGSFPAG